VDRSGTEPWIILKLFPWGSPIHLSRQGNPDSFISISSRQSLANSGHARYVLLLLLLHPFLRPLLLPSSVSQGYSTASSFLYYGNRVLFFLSLHRLLGLAYFPLCAPLICPPILILPPACSPGCRSSRLWPGSNRIPVVRVCQSISTVGLPRFHLVPSVLDCVPPLICSYFQIPPAPGAVRASWIFTRAGVVFHMDEQKSADRAV